MSDEIKDLKLLLKSSPSTPIPSKDFLSTGSTLLNLACSGKAKGGFCKGKYYLLVGDSSSGKTFLSMTCLAEASINPHFKGYRFIYDNVEDGMLMDVGSFFGKGVLDRLEPPRKDEESLPLYSSTIEEFYFNVDDACETGKPFIYILDSMDGLSSDSEETKFDDHKEAHRKGKVASGSYGTDKAKINSSGMRLVTANLRKTGSILIVISQTRDNIGFGSQYNPKTRSGGRALRFYATLELWSSVKDKIKKTVKGKERQLGITIKVEVKKNRITGRERSVEIPIYHTLGIDNLGSCIDYLVEEGHWTGTKGKVVAKDFDFSGSKESLIEKIQSNNLEIELRNLVSKVWEEIESNCVIKRKKRYE